MDNHGQDLPAQAPKHKGLIEFCLKVILSFSRAQGQTLRSDNTTATCESGAKGRGGINHFGQESKKIIFRAGIDALAKR